MRDGGTNGSTFCALDRPIGSAKSLIMRETSEALVLYAGSDISPGHHSILRRSVTSCFINTLNLCKVNSCKESCKNHAIPVKIPVSFNRGGVTLGGWGGRQRSFVSVVAWQIHEKAFPEVFTNDVTAPLKLRS